MKTDMRKFINLCESLSPIYGYGFRVYKNPTVDEILNLVSIFAGIRGTIYDGDMYIWDSFDATHEMFSDKLRKRYEKDDSLHDFIIGRKDKKEINRYSIFGGKCFQISKDIFMVVFEKALSNDIIQQLIQQSKTLREDVTSDIDAHDKAINAFRTFSNYIHNDGVPDFELTIGKKEYYAYKPEHFTTDDTLHNFVILLGVFHKNNISKSHGSFMYLGQKVLNKYEYAIVFNCLAEFKENYIKRGVLNTKFLSTFEHEYIHAIDFATKRFQPEIFSLSAPPITDKTKEEYYNDNAEFNAFYHTFASNWLRILKDYKEGDNFKDLMDLYDISVDFKTDLKKLINQSEQSKQFFNSLNQDKKRRYISRLYQLHKEIVSKL